LKITDAWVPPFGDSVARCRTSIGHRGRHPPATRAGIKLPDLNSCLKLLPCPSASLSKPHRRLRVGAAATCSPLLAIVPPCRSFAAGAPEPSVAPPCHFQSSSWPRPVLRRAACRCPSGQRHRVVVQLRLPVFPVHAAGRTFLLLQPALCQGRSLLVHDQPAATACEPGSGPISLFFLSSVYSIFWCYF
jgi:hypothetical protein